MAEKVISVRLRAQIGEYQQALNRAATDTRQFGRSVLTVADRHSAGFQTMGIAATAAGAAVAAGFGASISAAMDFESAFAGVRKTVDGTPEELAAISDGIRGMSRELPMAATGIADVAASAGQLGIETPNILDFTRTMVDLGETTNLQATDAANALARLANITQMPQDQFDRLGSTIVDLGNNLATTESEIVEMGLRLAGAGQQIGLSEAQILGFAGALSSVGIEAQAGGTAVSRVMIEIANEVRSTGPLLNQFAEVAGMSAEQFSTAFETDAAGAVITFIEGLGKMSAAGHNVFGVLEALELQDIRVRDALLRASGAGDLFRRSIELGSEAWDENTALAAEAEQRYNTTAAQLDILRNNIVDLAVDMGESLLPVVRGAADAAGGMLAGFKELPGPLQATAAALTGIAGGGSLALGAFVLLLPRLRDAKRAIDALAASSATGARVVGGFGFAAKAVGVALPGVIASMTLLGNTARRANEMLAADEAELGTPTTYSALADHVDHLIGRYNELQEAADPGGLFSKFQQEFAQNINPFDSNTIAEAEKATHDYAERINELQDAMAVWAANTGEVTEATGLTSDEVEKLAQKMGVDLGGATDDVVPALIAAADETENLRGVSEQATKSLEDQEAAAKALEERLTAFAQALGGFTNPFQAYQSVLAKATEAAQAHADGTGEATGEAGDHWSRYVGDVTVSLSELIEELEAQIAAQEEWKDNLARIARRGRVDVAQELAKLGPEGSRLVAQFANATDIEFDRAAELWMESTRRGGADSAKALETELKVMAAIGAAAGHATAIGIAQQLGLGVEEVRRIAKEYGLAFQEITSAIPNVEPGLLSFGFRRGRQHGGPVSTGSYIVGEAGPELLTLGAGMSGFVHPNQSTATQAALAGGSLTPAVQSGFSMDYERMASALHRQPATIPVIAQGGGVDVDALATEVADRLARRLS